MTDTLNWVTDLIKAIKAERNEVVKVYSPQAPYNWCIEAIKRFAPKEYDRGEISLPDHNALKREVRDGLYETKSLGMKEQRLAFDVIDFVLARIPTESEWGEGIDSKQLVVLLKEEFDKLKADEDENPWDLFDYALEAVHFLGGYKYEPPKRESGDLAKLQHFHDSSRGLWVIDRDPREVTHDWIKENAFQLDGVADVLPK